ncbi:MAG: hypothetical protein R3C12_18700 [Planctomycetaceae bacterium]
MVDFCQPSQMWEQSLTEATNTHYSLNVLSFVFLVVAVEVNSEKWDAGGVSVFMDNKATVISSEMVVEGGCLWRSCLEELTNILGDRSCVHPAFFFPIPSVRKCLPETILLEFFVRKAKAKILFRQHRKQELRQFCGDCRFGFLLVFNHDNTQKNPLPFHASGR